MDRSEIFEPINKAGGIQLCILFLMVVLMTIVAFRVATMFTNPISKLHNGVIKISHGDLNYRVDVRSRDEIGQLAVSFNAMAQKLKTITTDLRARESELKKINQELEERIEERTALAQKRAEKLQELASALTLTEQRERRRLAQILHDHLQQILIAAKISLGRLKKGLDESKLVDQADQVEELLDNAVSASRSLTVELSPLILSDGELPVALEWLARWFKEKHQLTVEVQAEPELRIPAEEVKIYLFQAVRELLFNVVKHAEIDHAKIRVFNQGNEIGVEVADEGKGVDIKKIDRKESLGFGLTSIQERLELLGGRLAIQSVPGKGSRFQLFAPAGEPKQPVSSIKKNRTKIGGHTGTINVLVVDDHKILRQGLINMLGEDSEIKIVGEAADGEQAVQKVSDLMPDVVIMDISMPIMNGIEATKRIKQFFPAVQVIGLSIHESEDMAETMRRAGASAYHNKNGPIDQLIHTIHELYHTHCAL